MPRARRQSIPTSTSLALQRAYEHLQQASSTPITTADLARAADLTIPWTRHVLAHASWWTPELAAASRAEAYRRTLPQREYLGQLGMQKARAARQAGWQKRKLNREKVGEIRELLSAGYTTRQIAELYHVHPNTILHIKHGMTWQKEPPPLLWVRIQPTSDSIAPAASPEKAHGLDQGLWAFLGHPDQVRLSRQSGNALVLEPATTDGWPITLLDASPRRTLVISRVLLQQLYLMETPFVSAALASLTHRLYVSDFAEEQRQDMVTIDEATRLLGCGRQKVMSLAASGWFHIFYDGYRRCQTIPRREVDAVLRQGAS